MDGQLRRTNLKKAIENEDMRKVAENDERR